MLPGHLKKLDIKMTLPTTERSTIAITQINNFETPSCTISNVHSHNQQQQTQQQPEQQFPTLCNMNSPSAATTTPTQSNLPSFFATQQLSVENVMPGIYLTKNFIAWTEQNLRAHGFTHIIIIDKHIQELYYPSPVFKLSTEVASDLNGNDFDKITECGNHRSHLSFSKEFEAIDLNFGEKSYLTTVLPNCYRAVKFINKALKAGGTILVIDCNGGEQKCLTIIVAFLMYKYNINFSDAFSRLKCFYKKADLDRFYTSQLYEYEPILQVQRAQSRGHSCSRELHSAILKRKKIDDGPTCIAAENNSNEFLLDTFNPLTQFHTHQQQQQQLATVPTAQQSLQTLSHQRSSYTSGFHAWDDYVMD